jgi:NAD(P)-dependent dehydrogenase (short-subunit alcohol dehydrogenase family)
MRLRDTERYGPLDRTDQPKDESWASTVSQLMQTSRRTAPGPSNLAKASQNGVAGLRPTTSVKGDTAIMGTIEDRTVLVTGANRGIGRALVEEALRRGAKRVYAGTRQPLAHSNGRVTPLTLDVTDAPQTQRAVDKVESLDVLINNAGIALYDDLSDLSMLERHLAVNLFGTYRVTQAFLPLLARARGAIVNNLSVNALAPLPLIPAYSISKAAAFNLTQSLRTLLAGRGVRVHAVLTGPVDTDMTRGLDIPKASPESIAGAIFDGVESDQEDIFPDPMSASIAESWRSGAAKDLERQYGALVQVEPVKSPA